MTTRNLRATPRQIGRLADAIRSVPSQLVGDHPSEDQFIGYSMDPPELSDAIIAKMDAHFSSCDDCAGRMEHLLEVSDAWRGEAGQRRLANLSLQIRSRAESFGALHALIGLANCAPFGPYRAALSAAAAAPLRVPDPSNRGAIIIRDDADFNLHVAVSMLEPVLSGTRITVDPFGASLVLQEAAPDEVAGEVLIPKSARERLPKGAVVELRIDSAERP
jgi:hypothetical protein